jgi:SAM-dependent methyltransferase
MSRLIAVLSRGLRHWMAVRGLAETASANSSPGPGESLSRLLQLPGKKFLHVGCGPARKPLVAHGFLSDEWNEIRLDIDPQAAPDVVATMLDMSPVPTGSVDAVYSSHNIEHLYPHEVPVALAEFLRVLKPDGLLVLTCPDLQSVSRLIADDKLTEAAYVSPAGPIAPLDILYGHRPQLAQGNLFMAHHTGFTLRSLVDAVRVAGFPSVAGLSRPTQFDLWLVATKSIKTETEMERLALTHLPAAA